MKQKVLLVATALCAVVFSTLALSADEPRRDGGRGDDRRDDRGPDVVWTPASVAVTLKPGESSTTIVTLTARDDLDPASVRVTSSLSPYISVSPTTTPKLHRGATFSIRVVLTVPVTALATTATGTLQLRRSERAHTPNSLVARPIPVALQVVWPSAESPIPGVTFSYPAFGAVSSIAARSVDYGAAGVATILNVQLGASADTMATRYQVTLFRGSTATTIQQWFFENIDPSGLLLASGAFSVRTLPNGISALVRTGEIPEAYAADNGPISGLFGMLPDRATVVSIQTSNDDAMRTDFGVSDAILEAQYLNLLSSFTTQ